MKPSIPPGSPDATGESGPLKSILFVTTSYPRFAKDFSGSFVHTFARCAARDGVRVVVVAPGAPDAMDSEVLDGVEVHRFRYFWPRSRQCLAYGNGGILANLRTRWLAIVQVPLLLMAMLIAVSSQLGRVQVVHCHWLPSLLIVKMALLLKGRRPLVFTNWGSDTRKLSKSLLEVLLRNVAVFVATAEETRQHLTEAGVESVRLISAPVDEQRFHRGVSGQPLREELGIGAEVPVLASVSRLNYFKDPLTFVRACGELRDRDVVFRAILAGDGDLADDVAAEVVRLELGPRVTMLGPRSDAEVLFAAAAVAVHISPVENTWATTISEAMAVGCPVVLTDVGNTRSTFTDEKDCLLVPSESSTALADAIERILENNDLAARLSAGGTALLEHHGKDERSAGAALADAYAAALKAGSA